MWRARPVLPRGGSIGPIPGRAGNRRGALLYHSMMTDPLSLSAGIGARLLATAALLALLWSGVAWALAA